MDVKFEQMVLFIRHGGDGAVEPARFVLQKPQLQRRARLVARGEGNVLQLASFGVLDVLARLASARSSPSAMWWKVRVLRVHVWRMCGCGWLAYMFRLRHSTAILSPLL
jgi:hypothetical protein